MFCSLLLLASLTGGGLQVVEVLAALRQRVPQWEVDGPDNIWILKPGGKSRGRGIHCFNNLAKLRHQVCSPWVLYCACCACCARTLHILAHSDSGDERGSD